MKLIADCLIFSVSRVIFMSIILYCVSLQVIAQENSGSLDGVGASFSRTETDESLIEALKLRLRVFDQPCLVDSAHTFLRGLGQTIPDRPGGAATSQIITIGNFEAATAAVQTVREAIYHLAAGRRAMTTPSRRVPGCIVHMSIVQINLLRHSTWRAIDFRSPSVQPIASALAGTSGPPAPASPEQATSAAVAGADGQEPSLRVFDQACADRAVITAVGEEVSQLTPERLTQFRDAMILLRWLPSTCIRNVTVVRPVLMATLLEGLPTTIDEVARQLGLTATTGRP